ncbi:hypothetical protein CBF18_16690, partial [Mastigocladus laminosus WC112]
MDNFESKYRNPGAKGQRDTGNQGTHRYGDIINNSSTSASPSLSASSSVYLVWYLLPIIGFFPSLWTLYRRQGSREQLAISRISITLAISWLLGYLFLATGAANLDFLSVRLLILNSFLTSGYFLISLWLIIVTIRG